MKKLYTLTLILFSLLTQAQFFPVGNGLPEQPLGLVRTVESASDFYVGFQKASSTNDVAFYKWNGLFWQTLPELKGASLMSIEFHQGSLYAATDVNNGFGSPNKLWRLNGTQWQDISPAGITGSGITELKAHPDSNRLVLGGNFQIPSIGASKLAYYDGNFRAYPALPQIANQPPDSIASLAIINNEIWAGGKFHLQDTLNLIKLSNGSNWEFPATFYQGTTTVSPQSYVRSVFAENGNHYATEGGKLYKVQSDTAYEIGWAASFTNFVSNSYGTYFSTQNPGIVGVLTGYVYYFDDGTESIQQASVPSGQSFGVGLKDSTFYVFPYGNPPNIIYNNVASNDVSSTQNAITRIYGKTYLDINGNCVFDTLNEPSLNGILLGLSGGSFRFYLSQSSGLYNFSHLQAGTWNLTTSQNILQIYKNITGSCNTPNIFNVVQGQQVYSEIGYQHNGDTDFAVDLNSYGGWRMRQGFAENYDLQIANPGISTANNVSVELELPANITFNQASPPAASTSGNTYTWNYTGMKQFEKRTINLSLTAPVGSTNLGDTLSLVARIVSPTTDDDPTDNIDTLSVIINAAYDPNDKQVSKPFIAPGTRMLDYQIRFQNTGNDTAYRVVVVDTLDTSLPINKIIMNSASHAYSIHAQNNILVWTFDNILLPDSTTDPTGSQGYIRFSAEIDPNLGVGDSVLNDAQIYFDFQKPIFTNKAKTLIVQNIGLPENDTQASLEIYPNPASERFVVINPIKSEVSLRIINSQGQLIKEYHLGANELREINTTNFENGVYFIYAGSSSYKLIVKK